jgi:TRAP-type mannitol/chloroaromatic compound transport system permease small subunit
MKALEGFQKGIHRTTYTICAVGMFLAIPLMLITTVDVLGRAIFNKPLPGTLELSEYMLSIIILCAAYTQQSGPCGRHFLTSKFPERQRYARS